MTHKHRLTWKDARQKIHDKILDQTYGPGDKLPRDTDIATEMGCARSTVHRAMRDLADSRIIERRRKGGTRVLHDPITRATFDIPIIRKEIEQKGAVHGYQLISTEIAEMPRIIAANMGFSSPEPALRVQALHLADQRPYLFEDRWIYLLTVPEIKDVDLEKHSANEWLLRNKPYSKCDLRFYAIKASEHDASILETSPGDALFVIDRTTWNGTCPITSVKAIAAPGYQLVTRA